MIAGHPSWIRILLVDGKPEGIRIVEKSNWTGVAVLASRSQLPEALARAEMGRPGIYVLTGEGEGGAPTLYVGEADVLRDRLKQHASRKDFWTRFVAFVSSNEGLNKAHVRYLESRLIALARAANQWVVENATVPAEPPLSEADRAGVDGFLREMLVIYPILGIDAFEAASAEVAVPGLASDLRLKERGAAGLGREVSDGFVVLAGSRARIEEVPSIHSYLRDLRMQLLERGVLAREGEHLVFTQDYRFSSPSTAAGVLVGGASNGRRAWKNQAGETLKRLQNARAQVDQAGDDDAG